METRHDKVLTPAKFRHLLRVTEATSCFPERDTLILLLGITCGMRVTEIARLEVHHVLSKSGARKEEIGLPGSITKGCRPRCIFLAHMKTVEAFDRYVEWRYLRGRGVSLDRSEYMMKPVEVASHWRKEQGYVGRGGVVVLFHGEAQGWVNKLRNPEH
jgi:integrase